MRNRFARLGLALALTSALAARADAQEDANADDDSDPCADVEDPCGGAPDPAAAGSGGPPIEDAEPTTDGNAAVEADASVESRAAMSPTLPVGSLAFTAALQVGLSAEDVGGEAGNPLSIAPDLWYGVTERLTLGAVTSIQAVTGFWSGAQGGLLGTGACLSDEPGTDPSIAAGCAAAFDNAGVEGLIALKADDSTGIALDLGFHADSFDRGFYDVKVGARGALRSGRLGFGVVPSVLVAVTERGDFDEDGNGGNLDQIQVPVDLGVYVTPAFQIGVQSGIRGSLQHFGDDFVVPLAFGAILKVNERILAAASFSLDRVTGASIEGDDGPGAADLRSASLLLGYML